MKTVIGVEANILGGYTIHYSDGTTEVAPDIYPQYPALSPPMPILPPPPTIPISPPINCIDIQITIEPEICSACNEATKYEDIHTQYNPSMKPELNRVICRFCHTKALDKFYGVNRNADNEKTLYGK